MLETHGNEEMKDSLKMMMVETIMAKEMESIQEMKDVFNLTVVEEIMANAMDGILELAMAGLLLLLLLLLSRNVSPSSGCLPQSFRVPGLLLHRTTAEMVTRQSHGGCFIVLLLCCYCRVTLLLLPCYCVVILVLLCCYCVVIVLLLCCYCVVISIGAHVVIL